MNYLCGNSWVCFERLCIEVVRSRGFIVFQSLDGVCYFLLGGVDVSILRSSTATGMSGSVSGGDLFNISLKYSAYHGASCVSSDINSFPSLSLIGASKVLSNLPTNLFCDNYCTASPGLLCVLLLPAGSSNLLTSNLLCPVC